MTERARFELYEERLRIYSRDGGICQACGEPVDINSFQVAHRIANTKANRSRWGTRVIDHPINKATTHPGRCNDAMNCGFNPSKAQAIADEISIQFQ